MKFWITIICFLLSINLFSQNSDKSRWKEYFSYRAAKDMLELDGCLYVAADNGILKYNLSDYSLSRLSKLNGLSDIGITCMVADSAGDLLIGYGSGNFDIFYANGDKLNVPDIKNKTLFGDKSIYSATFVGQMCYLSTGLGILTYNLARREFGDSYYIGEEGKNIRINQLYYNSDDDTFWAATEDGLYRAARSQNLTYFDNWHRDNTFAGDGADVVSICKFGDKIFAAYNKGDSLSCVYYFAENKWTLFDDKNFLSISHLDVKADKLLITASKKVKIYKSNLMPYFVYDGAEKYRYCYMRTLIDSKGEIWISDNIYGAFNAETEKSITENLIARNVISDIRLSGDDIWIAEGKKQNWYTAQYSRITKYWIYNFGKSNNIKPRVFDAKTLAISPDGKEVYCGTWGCGLLYSNNTEDHANTLYDTTNSPLQAAANDAVHVVDMQYDDKGNLWILQWIAAHPLSVITKSGEWIRFDNFSMIESWTNCLHIDRYGQKWMGTYSAKNPLVVYSDNGTIDDTSDDVYRVINLYDKEGNNFAEWIYSIEEDTDGKIWIGTNHGVASYATPKNVLKDDNVLFSRIKVEVDGYVDYLMASDDITCMALDGGNQKWFGTDGSGVFLVSEDGETQVAHFTTQNSPLPSDKITVIRINGETGEVFIGTDKGMVSYHGAGTSGSDFLTNVKIYPNPVREDYSGDVCIDGLVEDTFLKITDLSGNLVYETTSIGGRATWNCKNLKGNRVSTGVYLVFMSANQDEETCVAKIMVIN